MGDALMKPGVAAVSVQLTSVNDVFRLAEALAGAKGFVPSHLLGNPGGIAAAILTGAELGMQPMEAMRSLHIVEGKPTMAADVMLARAIRAGIKHKWEKSDATEAVLKLERAGFEPYYQRWTLDDAKAAGLVGKGNWSKYSAAMLRARCISAGLRAYCPDVLGSQVYAHGELDDEPANAPPPGASGSIEVQVLGDVQDAAPHPGGEDPLVDVMDELAHCTTDSHLRNWVYRNSEALEREPQDERKVARWKAILAAGRRVLPPVRADELKRVFAEAREMRTADQKRALAELQSVETREAVVAWADDNAEFLASLSSESPLTQEVWASVKRKCEAIGVDVELVEGRVG